MAFDKTQLVECPANDFYCPYWDYRYQKCAMAARGEGRPQEECDCFYDEDEEENF